MESQIGVTCAVLLLACTQIQAQFPGMAMGMGMGMGMGPGLGQGGFSPMAAYMGFHPCDPFAQRQRPPPNRAGAPRGGRTGQGQSLGGGATQPGRFPQQRSPVPNFANLMFGMSMDIPDAPDVPAMPFPGPGGRMTWTGCYCQPPEFGFGSGECMGALTGHLRNDICMQAGLCCTCDFGMRRR